MDIVCKRALENSIRKWKKIVDGKGGDNGISNCALCKTYRKESEHTYCKGCPVKKKTKRDGCDKTPYGKWISHQEKGHENYFFPLMIVEKCKTCERYAKEELNFLKSLREKKKVKK